MKKFRKILVGIDRDPEGGGISEGSRRAALQAQWLADRTGASLTLFHSTFSDPESPERGGTDAIDTLAEEYDLSGVPVELVYSQERPSLAMIHRILRGQNDLVVVAKRNEPTRDERRVGSVTVKLMRKCPAPVWAVKPGSDLVHGLILAATDLTPVGDLATEYGAYLAAAYGCKLHVVHAWQLPFELHVESGRLSDEEVAQHVRAIEQAAIHHIKERLGPSAGVGIHVSCTTPSRAILASMEQDHPDLLVMGTISRSWVVGLLVGNTAEKLMERVDCSILAVKPEDFVSTVKLGG